LINLLNLEQVCEILSVKKSSIWAWIKNGKFPKPIKIGERNTRWIESEIKDYINSKKDSRSEDRETACSNIKAKLKIIPTSTAEQLKKPQKTQKN